MRGDGVSGSAACGSASDMASIVADCVQFGKWSKSRTDCPFHVKPAVSTEIAFGFLHRVFGNNRAHFVRRLNWRVWQVHLS